MIGWVHQLAIEWGAYMRSNVNAYNSRNILHRMMVEGIGAAHIYRSAPLEFSSEESEHGVLSFHRAFLRLPERNRDVIYVLYVPQANIRTRLAALKALHGLNQTAVYKVRNLSHAQIWGFIDAHISMVSANQV